MIDTEICTTHFQILRQKPTMIRINGVEHNIHGLFSLNPKGNLTVEYRVFTGLTAVIIFKNMVYLLKTQIMYIF